MKKLRFCLLGDGQIARYHRKAIEHVGGEIGCVIDPKYDPAFNRNTWRDIASISQYELIACNYFVICSPSFLHYSQIQWILSNTDTSSRIICEKPAFLPWENIIDDDRINIVLQLRYLPDLPGKADLVIAHFLRDQEYFLTWKGNAKKTGGIFYNIWIHYLDLAILMDADFEGSLNLPDNDIPSLIQFDKKTKPIRRSIHFREWNNEPPGGQLLNIIDLQKIDMQACYNRLYEDVISGGGIKPKDILYLNWALQRNSEIFGYGLNGMNRLIKIGKELL